MMEYLKAIEFGMHPDNLDLEMLADVRHFLHLLLLSPFSSHIFSLKGPITG